MPTLRYYVKQKFGSGATALPDIVRFLIDDHPTLTGPGWTIVEAQSSSNRETPSDATDLDSLVSATDWPGGTLSVGDWIVLESANANNTNHFQLYLEYNGTTSFVFMLIPLEDFSTGGGAASPPTFPATAFGNGGSVHTFSIPSTLGGYTVVADEGMMTLVVDSFDVNLVWGYFGEINPISNTRDPRAYVIWDDEFTVGWSPASFFNRLSPVDNSTILTAGYSAILGIDDALHTDLRGRVFTSEFYLPVGVYFITVDAHFAGWLRGVYSGANTGDSNNVNVSPQGRFFRISNSTSPPEIAIKWNGAAY